MHPKLATGRVGIYARYSTDLQSERSIDDQVRRAHEAITRAGGNPGRATLFPDSAASGASRADRPGMDALLRAVDAGEIDIVITEDVSRLARDLEDAAHIFKRLEFARVPLIGLSDGIDTSSKNAKMNFAIMSMFAEQYLDALRDKTLRGLEGRAAAGFATGGVPFGYRTEPVTDPRGGILGHRIEIDPAEAKIVRRIFTMYRDGQSLTQIAHRLNREGIPSPREGTQHTRMGWGSSTIRAMLYNDKYAGLWRFKERQWVKAPGTNRRVPKARPADEVMSVERPDLRIIHPDLWQDVRARLDEVRKKYTEKGSRAVPVRSRGNYVLSGLLVCDACNAPLMIYGGTSARYYKCGTRHRKGVCDNDITIREDVARKAILGRIREHLVTPDGVAHIRKQVTEYLRDYSKTLDDEMKERRERLARTDQRIKGLVGFIADGDRSESVVSALRDLEAAAKSERAAIDRLAQAAKEPLRLPSIEEVVGMAKDLEARAAQDPIGARAQLQRWHKGGTIRVGRDKAGQIVAQGELLSLVILSERMPETSKHPSPSDSDWGAKTFVAGAGFEPATFGL